MALAKPSLRLVPVSTNQDDGPLAVSLSSGYGLVPDDWQADWVACSLHRRPTGRYAAATSALAVPRQNGKNGGLEVRELYGMVVLGEKFLHTAHEVKTARKAFKRIASFFENVRHFPELAALLVEIRKTNGQEAIVLSNGGSIEFIARSSGSGRGFTVDVLVCDEVQDLTDDELAALLPTVSSAPLGNAQVIFTGTPPDPNKYDTAKGEVIRRVRKEAQAGTDPNLCFVDYGVPDGPLPDIDNRELWHQVNPALGGRLNIEEVERERNLMSPETFARERLGWWGDPEVDSHGAINLATWASRKNNDPEKSDRATLVIDVAPDRRYATIGRASYGAGGRTQVVALRQTGTNWIIPKLLAMLESQDIVEVALHPGWQAGALIPELGENNIEWFPLTTLLMGQSCAAFQTAVIDDTVEHLGQPELDAAVENAKTRYMNEAEVWDRRDHAIDISPLVACSAAAFRWELQDPDYDLDTSVG